MHIFRFINKYCQSIIVLCDQIKFGNKLMLKRKLISSCSIPRIKFKLSSWVYVILSLIGMVNAKNEDFDISFICHLFFPEQCSQLTANMFSVSIKCRNLSYNIRYIVILHIFKNFKIMTHLQLYKWWKLQR